MSNTTNMPEVRINRALTISTMREVLDTPHGKSALLLLSLLIWRRQYDGDEWISVTNGEWNKRVNKDRKGKYRAGKALEKLGLVTIQRTGKQSLQYKLASCVDPLAAKKNITKVGNTLAQSEQIMNLADLPDPILSGPGATKDNIMDCIAKW